MAQQQERVMNIYDKLEQGSQAKQNEPWTKHSIYKIPHWMKDGERPDDDKITGYIPEIVSIGPYHHGKSYLKPMEVHKWRILHHMLSRVKQDITLYLTEITKLENDARNCYDQTIERLDSNQFVEMLVLDGCFVLEFLKGQEVQYPNLDYRDDDPVFSKESIRHIIAIDLMKLENQMPMIVLQKLLEIQYNGRAVVDVPKLVMSVLTPNWVTLNMPVNEEQRNKMREVVAIEHNVNPMVHCLDVFWRSMLYKPSPCPSIWVDVTVIWDKYVGKMNNCAGKKAYKTQGEHIMTYCISELRNAGIKFKPRHCLPFWEVHFKERRGVLEIHPFKIDHATETVFRNLIAYEQCHMSRPWDMVITNYVAFMDNLIDTASDVAYLHKAGIIVHYLGSDTEVADLFNRLVKKVYVNKKDGRLHSVYQKLNKHCRHKRYQWGASLKNEYLPNPWVITSIFVALLLFLLTALQTGYTVYAYHHPPS